MNSKPIAIVALTLLASALAPRPARADDGGVIVALEVGSAGVRDSNSSVYGSGFGKSLVLGYRFRKLTVEWHFSQSYRQALDETLDAEASEGALGLSTLGVRHIMQGRTLVVSGFAGLTRAEMPVLVLEAGVNVERQHLAGWGAIGGIGVGVPLARGQVLVSVEARAAWVSWSALEFDDPFVSSIEVTGDNSVAITQSTEDITGMPWTLALRLRFLL